ncbi:T6SS immunity protein Tli4 family protein [Alcanivorax xiamenensis]|uniref:T6SS immunity protein Tli4 family protein n=1 Tax=Alcanivorax xiamenensis TaxID=1177156 RepID=UPI001358E97E|nr:T6SS immunity protein Tli4 family protein [Alcanivorax xiamenensis]
MTRTLFSLALAALALISIGCDSPGNDTKDYALMNQIPLTAECVGYMRIGLPDKGRRAWSATVDGAGLALLKGLDRTAFDTYVESRKEKFAALPHNVEPNRLVTFRSFGDKGTILLYREDAFQTEVVEMERYLWVGSDEGAGRGYFLDSGSHFGKVEQDLESFSRVFAKFSLRQPGESTSNGFCIDGASLADDGIDVAADVTVSLPGQPGWDLYVSYAKLGSPHDVQDTEGLDERLATATGSLELEQEKYRRQAEAYPGIGKEPDYPKHFEVLRKGSRELAGVKGGEAAWKKELNNGGVLYTFLWMDESLSGQSAMVEMNTRDEEQTASSEERMFALWDAVLASVEFRGH